MVVGAPYWGWYPYGDSYAYPYGYPYAYPYCYPAYAPLVVVDSAPQTSLQQGTPAQQSQQQSWYYCQNPQGYYPYVGEWPGGWQPVSPQPPLPTR